MDLQFRTYKFNSSRVYTSFQFIQTYNRSKTLVNAISLCDLNSRLHVTHYLFPYNHTKNPIKVTCIAALLKLIYTPYTYQFRLLFEHYKTVRSHTRQHAPLARSRTHKAILEKQPSLSLVRSIPQTSYTYLLTYKRKIWKTILLLLIIHSPHKHTTLINLQKLTYPPNSPLPTRCEPLMHYHAVLSKRQTTITLLLFTLAAYLHTSVVILTIYFDREYFGTWHWKQHQLLNQFGKNTLFDAFKHRTTYCTHPSNNNLTKQTTKLSPLSSVVVYIHTHQLSLLYKGYKVIYTHLTTYAH